MSNTEGRPRAKSIAKRRRDVSRVAGLLKEYTGKLSRIADRLHAVLVTPDPFNGTLDYRVEVIGLFHRRAAIAGVIESVARAASGMIEHYDLEPLDHAELVLRLREAETALEEVRVISDILAGQYPKAFPTGALKDTPYEWPKSTTVD